MNAYEFCKFFDFTLEKKTGVDDEGNKYEWIATDDQKYFKPRTADKIEWLAEMFEYMLIDYVDDTIEYHGFKYSESEFDPDTYYGQAYNWIKTSELKDTDTAQVVAVLAGVDTLTA